MANVDRPDGFRPVMSANGAPWNGSFRAIIPGSDDIFIGDPITISSGAAVQMAVAGECAGVCVGLGTVDSEGHLRPMTPDNNTQKFFDTSALTEADWRILYVPAEDMLFEAQFDDAEDIVIGEAYDLLATDGDQTTGRSLMEINGNALTADGDVMVVAAPQGPQYDQTSGENYKRVYVKFVDTQLAAPIA